MEGERYSSHGLEQRLSVFLVAEYDRYGKTHIHLTHNYTARHIGTSRERVIKTLKKLNDKKLIHKSKGCIELTNIDGLRIRAWRLTFQATYLDFRP